jgi:SAM-dependent methyltransferase
MESLNEEYASKPVFARPPDVHPQAQLEIAQKRVTAVHKHIDLASKRVLEVGCGHGLTCWLLSHHLGCEAWGVDVVERASWKELADGRTHFECVDITVRDGFSPSSFDRVVSFSVWEHMTRPLDGLRRTYELLRPEGLAWIRANLYRGPLASHRYREINFPWPHLLFSDEVFKEFYRRRGWEQDVRAAWVNKLTWEQYERAMLEIGFEILMLRFDVRPIDQDFYQRFEDVLGRYPRTDLERDFFTVVLRKP